MVSGEEIDEAVDWLKSQGDSVSADMLLALKARAETAEAKLKASIEEDERMDCYQYGTKPTIDWKTRTQAAEKEAAEFLRALDKGATMQTISVEARSEINHWRGRAEKAEYEAKRWKDVAGKQASWETLWAEQVARTEAAEASLAESEEKSDQRLKMALEWKRSRDDYYERLDLAKAKLTKARKALQWYADNFVVNGSRARAVLAELEEPK